MKCDNYVMSASFGTINNLNDCVNACRTAAFICRAVTYDSNAQNCYLHSRKFICDSAATTSVVCGMLGMS